jgi:hypothetical protein
LAERVFQPIPTDTEIALVAAVFAVYEMAEAALDDPARSVRKVRRHETRRICSMGHDS